MDKVNVLLVDDRPGKLLTYESILGELDGNLLKAHSGIEALECLLKTDVAVVLIDVCMPELDGFELADMIIKHPRFQKTAIIFISGIHMTDLDRLKGYEHGRLTTFPYRLFPNCCEPRSESLWNFIVRPVNSKCFMATCKNFLTVC